VGVQEVYQDTIAAISTPLGEGGIGIVRLSGEEAYFIAQQLFSGRLSDRQLSYGHVLDPRTGDVVDEVLVSYMAAPRTYTREDVVEINCHSGPLVLQRILEISLASGARLATPGEFTLRAFLNGRIDLAQAEAVLDVIRSKTEAGLRLAVDGLRGRLSGTVNDIRTELMSVLAYLTAVIDFPEDEIEKRDIVQPLQASLERLRELIAGADNGIVYRQGVRTAIVGRPNVGKSSLLNRLLRKERAIVASVPGTTRDTIEEVMNLQGVPFILVDTAGLLTSDDLVESLGVERSRKAIQEADFVLAVIDASEPITEADKDIIASVGDKGSLLVANKADLPCRAEISQLPGEVVFTSALTGEGMSHLEQQMVNAVLRGGVLSSDALLVDNPRHKDALERAERHIAQALSASNEGMAEDFVSIDLTAAVSALGEITGDTVQDELLDMVFSQFCIGK
jgi:tRNA modification GTPase